MTQNRRSIDDRLMAAQVAIDNAKSDSEIATLLNEFGYDPTRLDEGKAFYDSAQDLHQKQKTEYGEQYAAWTKTTKKFVPFVY